MYPFEYATKKSMCCFLEYSLLRNEMILTTLHNQLSKKFNKMRYASTDSGLSFNP